MCVLKDKLVFVPAMKAYGGNGINLHSFLTWAINGVNHQLHALATMALEPFWTLRKTIIWLKSRFFLRCTSGLRYSGILRSVDWYRVTDVSGQPFRPIFRETSVKKTTNYAANIPQAPRPQIIFASAGNRIPTP